MVRPKGSTHRAFHALNDSLNMIKRMDIGYIIGDKFLKENPIEKLKIFELNSILLQNKEIPELFAYWPGQITLQFSTHNKRERLKISCFFVRVGSLKKDKREK